MRSGVFGQLIDQARSIAILLHLKPDHDALGAATAMTLAYPEKTIVVVLPEKNNRADSLLTENLTVVETIPSPTDLILVLDCGDSKRTGLARQLKTLQKKTTVVVIDHHKERGDLARITLHYAHLPKASSTCEILADFFFQLNRRLSRPAATALLAGIIADTQGFRHAPNPISALETASKLISLGARHQQVIELLLPTLTQKQMKLWGELIVATTINSLGIARTVVFQKTQERYQTTPDDLIGLATLLSLINEAKMAILMIEEDGHWKIVLKSRHLSVALNKLARIFDGKGRSRSAVFRVTKTAFSSKIIADFARVVER